MFSIFITSETKTFFAKYFGMDMPKQGSDFGMVSCHGSCYLLG
jgi:hypothetical protein